MGIDEYGNDYIVTCDHPGCTASLGEDDPFPYNDQAEECASENGWETEDDEHWFCPEHKENK